MNSLKKFSLKISKISLFIFILLLNLALPLNQVRAQQNIVVEYAEYNNTISFSNSTDLLNIASEVDSRICVEYAEMIMGTDLVNSTSLNLKAEDVEPGIVVEYADSNYNYNLEVPDRLYALFEGPDILINTLDGNFYDEAPLMDVDFEDASDLDAAYYKVDSYLPLGNDTSGWIEIFSDYIGTSFSTDFFMDSSIWSSLSEGSHNIYFKAWDDLGYVIDGPSHSLLLYKDTNGPLISVNSLNDNYYSTPPTIDIDFYDLAGLDNAYYKVDSYTPLGTDTTGWIEIFSDHLGTSYTLDFVLNDTLWALLAEGSHTVYFKAWDDLGNINDGPSPSWQFNIDLTCPSIILNTINNSCFKSPPLIDIDFLDYSDLDDAYYKVDSYTPLGTDTTGWIEIFSDYFGTSYSTDFFMDSSIWTSLSDGSHIIYFKVWDDLGNVHDGPVPALGFIKDTEAPVITIKTSSGGIYNLPPSIDIEIFDSIGLDDAYYKVDSYTPLGTDTTGWIEIFSDYGEINYTSLIDLDENLWNALTDGLHTVYHKSWDLAGNINDGSTPSWQFFKDSSGPNILINNVNNSPYNSVPTLDVDFSDSSGLDDAYYKVDSYTPLGTNTSGWIEIFSDHLGTSYTLDFTLNETLWASLPEGSHTVYFKAVDDLGNLNDGEVPSWQFIIDFSDPQIIVNLENDSYYNAPPLLDIDFFDLGGLDSAYYKVDSFLPLGSDTSGWIEIFSDHLGTSSTLDFTLNETLWASLPEGSHTVYFKAVDDLGNINDGSNPSWQFNIDTSAPNITINTPTGKPFSIAPTFNVTFEDKYNLESAYYKIESYNPMGLDITGWEPIFIDITDKNITIDILISDFIWNGMEEGLYKVYIKCWDDLGNVNDGPNPYWEFFKYFGIPIIEVNTPQGGYYNNPPLMDIDFYDPTKLNNAYYKVDSYNPLGLETANWYQIFSDLNGVNYTTNFYMNSSIWSSLSEGSHVVYFKVWNYSGIINDGAHPSWQFYKDTIPPIISLLSPVEGGIYQSIVSVSINITGYQYYYYCWDEDPFIFTNSTLFALPFEDGSHTLHLQAVDIAGNTEMASFVFITDNTPPTAEIVGMQDNLHISRLITIRVTPYDEYGINYVSFSLGSQLLSEQTSDFIYQFDPTMYPFGNYIFTITIEDLAGNVLSRDFSIYLEEPVSRLPELFWTIFYSIVGAIVSGVIGLVFWYYKKKH